MGKIMKKCLILLSFILIQGCTSKIAVMTLEQTIQNAAEAAQKGANGASTSISIEVAVTNGYKAGATAPIPVVPIEVSASSSITTKLKMDVDLTTYTAPAALTPTNSVFILDTETGILE